jgi:hypothetical protein
VWSAGKTEEKTPLERNRGIFEPGWCFGRNGHNFGSF